MASLAPKKLHFYSTIENEHLTETPVESINCKFVTLPTLSVPSYNYIKLNFSSTRELQFLINQNSGHIPASVVPPSLKGEIVVDYGNGERDVYETTYEPAASNYYKISEGSINSIKIFPYDEPRVVTLWGDIHGLQVKGPNFTTGGTNTTAYRVTNVEINGMSSLLDTGYMLKDHSLLTSVDLSSFDSSNLENVGGMFMNCTSLETVNLSGFNTSNLKSLYAFFYACTKLKTIINIENINTSSVTNLQSLFYNCGELTSLDLSKWDVSKVTHMNSMFAYCNNLTSVNLSNWITTSLKSVGSMFLNCIKLTSININHFRITEGNTASFGSNAFEMMFKQCKELTSINLGDWNSITTRSLEQMFQGCTKLTTITLPVKGITTTSFWSTFGGCSVLTTINNLDKINTREVMIFENMFAGCQNIISLDLSNFDTRSALVMSGMFSMCKKLQTLSGVENWNTKTLMYAKQMFYDTPQINNISFEKWCTPDVIAHSSFRTDSALQSEPTWSEPYCEFCCPLVEHGGVRFVFSNLNRTPDQHSTYKVNGSPTHTGYEMLPTTGTETISEYKTLIEETDTTILEYSGFDEGGKLCAIVVPHGTYTLDEVSGINDSETFKNVSLNGNVIGKIRKLINNTDDGKNTIFYTTDKSTCYEGEYGSGDTIILSPFVAPTPSPTPTPLPTPTPIPDCRPKQPRDVSCTDVALHIQSNGDDPILDSSKNNAKITKYGDVKNSTEKTILESESSLYFDGNGDYLEIDQESIKSEIYDIGDDDFTIEFWFNSKSLATRQGILSTNHADAETENDAKYDALFIGLEDRSVTYNELANNGTNHNTIFVMFRRDDMTTKFKYLSKKIEANTWYHFALVRENNLLNTFLNGEAIDNQYSYSSNNYDRYMTGGILKNGYDGEKLNLLVGKFGLHYFNGYIQDLRITRKAVYENTCVVIPSSLFDTNAVGSTSEPLCSEIQLHIKSDTVNESDFIFDDSDYNNQITMVGNVHHETDEPFIGKSSIYFDGNGDHLDIGDTSTFKFLHDKTTDFTIEGWVYANSVSPHTTLFTTNGGTSANVGCSAIIYPDGGIYFETYRGVSETRGIHYGGGNKTLFKFSAWNHVVITFSKSEDKVEIYVNGIEIEGSAGFGANSPSLANSNIPLTIGRYPTNSTNLNGYIQNFRISKKKVYTGCFALPRDFTSLCDPTPTPTPKQPTPTPTEEVNFGGDEQTPTPTTILASTTSTAEAVAGTKVIEIPDSDTSKFSANMEIVIAPDDDTKREENVIDSIGSLILKNELQNTHPVGTRIVEKATSNNEDDPTPTPTKIANEPINCPDGKIAEWQLPNGDPCDPSQATLKTFFGLSMNLNNEWENVFDGLTIKFGEQETANGVDYLPIYAKVDNNKIALSSGNNVSEWNRLYLFVGDNKNPNANANGEGIEFDTIVTDNNSINENEVKTISAKIPFRFADINGIPTLQIKNILKPTHSAFNNRNVESDWSSVYVGPGYDLNDDVWPSASVDVNYEIGPITYSSIDCNQVCVDAQTPTPTTANYFAEEETNCVLFKDQGNWFGTNHNICFDLNTNEVRFADLKLIDENIPSDFTGNDSDVNYAIVKKDALDNITDLIELEDMMYDSMVTFAFNSNLFIRNSYIANTDSPYLYSPNSYLNANHDLQYTIYDFTNSDNPNYLSWKGDSEVVLIMYYGDFNGTTYGPGSRRIFGKVEFAEV